MSQDLSPYPQCLEPIDCCLWIYMSSRAPLVRELKPELEASYRADALSSWQSPEGRAWLEDAAWALGAPWCPPALVFQSTRPRSGRAELWLLVAVHGEEAEKLGCRVSAGCGEEGTWTQSCHLLATRLQAKLRWESSLKLCHCAGRNAQFTRLQR